MKDNYRVIKRLVLSEKYDHQRETLNRYYFQVDRDATKPQIKRAVEQLFDVRVTKVNTFNRIGKLKRERRMNYGRTAASKRAVVTLAEGNSIDMT